MNPVISNLNNSLRTWTLQGPAPVPAPAANPAFAHLFIVNPLSGRYVASLFSTHPAIADRVARLRSMQVGRAA